jgi:hypothetical protein
MPFENLAGIFGTKLDGNLTVPNTDDAPIVCVLGTSAQGDAETLFTVVRPSDAAALFGKSEGTLIRGMYESAATGAQNIRLFRIGATAAFLEGLAGGGLSIETLQKDDTAGEAFKIWFDSTSGRLRVYRASDDILVYDTGDGTLGSGTDLNEVVVDGDGVAGGVNVGSSAATAVLLSAVTGVDGSATFTAGADGLSLNRMQTYEALDEAYSLLEDAELDIVVPMNVYLDDNNFMDLAPATASGLMASVTGHGDVVAGAANDMLTLLYKEEFQGQMYYFWDVDGDGVAEIVPTVRGLSSGQQTTLDGGAHSIAAVVAGDPADLDSGSFHEVNFGYQLANFCFRQSHLNTEMHGTIGVLPPKSFAPKDVSIWVGSRPVTALDANGNEFIVTNGTGLLGNKWVAGRKLEGTVPAHLIDGAAAPWGGFIATDDGYVDGLQLKDANDALVDIGKYLDLVSAYPLLVNPSQRQAYAAAGAASYAGLLSTLPAATAATNKIVPNVQLPFRLNTSKVDALSGLRYVHFFQKSKGIVAADAPTAARPESDYNRRSTMQIVKATLDSVRRIGEPFLGQGINNAQIAALETAIGQGLSELVKAGVLVRFDLKVTATALQRVRGEVNVELVLVPAFELRQINVTVALAAA